MTKKKRDEDALCPRCRRGGFTVYKGVTKPMFKCQACDDTWCSGYDGGGFFKYAANSQGRSPSDFVEFPHSKGGAA